MAQYTTSQLQRALKTQRTIESLQSRIDSLTNKLSKILGGGGNGIASPFISPKGKRKVSAAGRVRMAAAQKARWAKLNGKGIEKPAKKGRRKMSAAAKAKISAAAKLRWKKAKAAGKSRL
jgi:hypothetical protein